MKTKFKILPDDYSHAQYLKEQRELKKPNGKICKCGKLIYGNNKMFCPECHRKNKEKPPTLYDSGKSSGHRKSVFTPLS